MTEQMSRHDTNFTVFGSTRSGIKSTIYRTQDEHANHYITDAVIVGLSVLQEQELR
jgi:hypothetical protein